MPIHATLKRIEREVKAHYAHSIEAYSILESYSESKTRRV